MTQTEGEKEIVLGNKQLISLFFVVVALMGVCMAAGYMIGRKSVTPGTSGSVTDTQTSTSRPESEPPRETAEATPTQSLPAPVETVRSQPPTETAPARKETADSTEKPSHKAEKSDKAEKLAALAESAVTKPEAGATYLQVTALRHPDCDNLVRSLREQNFPATLASSSKEGLLRVLVGPYHETAKVADAKLRLKALGFANAFVQR